MPRSYQQHNLIKYSRKRWGMEKILQRIDVFGRPLPAFNIKGRSEVNTRVGGLISLIIISTVLVYASIKLMFLIKRHNPQLSSYSRDSIYIDGETVILNEQNFRIAFAIEGFGDTAIKLDPRYVKYIFRMYGLKNNEPFERILPYHECTEEDYAQFYPIQS